MFGNKYLKIALVFLALVVVAGVGFISWKIDQEINDIYSGTDKNLINRKPAVDTSGWEIYRNEQYGFELKFPLTWKGVEITTGEENNAINYDSKKYSFKFVKFTHPQKISSKGNLGDIWFEIGIFDENNWKLAQGWGPLGNSGDKFFGSAHFNGAAPDDLLDRAKEITAIRSTFKILE